jgi:hypothetical protein
MKASCQSLTSSLIKVTGDFLQKYQDFRRDAAKIYVNTIIPGKGDTEKAVDKLIDDAFGLQSDLMNAYDKVSGEGSWKIGARHILVPTKKVTGSLIATERTFVIPATPFDKLTITIKKTDGKAGADIAVCAKYSTGEYFNKKEKSIDKGEETVGREVNFVLDDMADKPTTIHLVHTGLLTNKFEYTVSVEGEFNQAEMEKLGKSSKAA